MEPDALHDRNNHVAGSKHPALDDDAKQLLTGAFMQDLKQNWVQVQVDPQAAHDQRHALHNGEIFALMKLTPWLKQKASQNIARGKSETTAIDLLVKVRAAASTRTMIPKGADSDGQTRLRRIPLIVASHTRQCGTT